jgi:hypothetical protein
MRVLIGEKFFDDFTPHEDSRFLRFHLQTIIQAVSPDVFRTVE